MMIMRNNILSILTATVFTLLLAGCEAERIAPEPTGKAITFIAENNWGDSRPDSPATKATSEDGTLSVEVTTVDKPITRADGETTETTPLAEGTFGVFADYYAGGTGDPAAFMVNQEVSYDGTYSPTKYWSTNPTDKFKFYAYYPHVANTIDNGESFINESTATVTYKLDGRQNIMWAKPIDKTPGGGSVKMNFKHLMSALSFKFVNNSSEKVIVNNITISNTATSASLNIKDETCEPTYENIQKLVLKPDDTSDETWTVAKNNGTVKDTFYIAPSETALSLSITIGGKTYPSVVKITPEVDTNYKVTITIKGGENPFPEVENGVLEIENEDRLKKVLKGDYAGVVHTYKLTKEGGVYDLKGDTLPPSNILSFEVNGAEGITFDGRECEITNFTIEGDGDTENVGLFNSFSTGNSAPYYLKNLTISNFSVTNEIQLILESDDLEYGVSTGGLVGYSKEGTIENCHVKNFSVISTELKEGSSDNVIVYTGGIVGYSDGTTINGCTVMGAVTDSELNDGYGEISSRGNADKCYSGGICGYTFSEINACCVSIVSTIGAYDVTGAPTGYAGTLAGYAGGANGCYCENQLTDVYAATKSSFIGELNDLYSCSFNYYNKVINNDGEEELGAVGNQSFSENDLLNKFICIENFDVETLGDIQGMMNSVLNGWQWNINGDYDTFIDNGETIEFCFPFLPEKN